MKKKIKVFVLVGMIVMGFNSCRPAQNLRPLNKKPKGKSKLLYFLDQKNQGLETEDGMSDKKKYIFIRLYDPNYNDPMYIANSLQKGIAFVEVNPENVSHASIGFDLSDYFFGLTSGGKYNLKIERCTDVASNDYMEKCNPEKSIQSTYAIPVTNEEYERAYNLILKNLNNKQLKYAATENIKIAGYCVRRKFFTPEEQQKLGSEQLENKLYDIKKDFKKHVKPIIQDQMFVCSTFVAWVLYNSVDSVHQWFDDHKIDYEYITPSDLSQIEGVEFLFSSTWTKFDEAAEEFAKVNEEFADYLPVE